MSDTTLRAKIIRLAAELPKGSPGRKALLDVVAADRRAAPEAKFTSVEQATTSYRVDHPEYGTFDLENNADGSGWYLTAVAPSPSSGVRRNEIIPRVSSASVGDSFLSILKAHVEQKLAALSGR